MKKILENEAEKPIQILVYSQVLSYQNRLRKYEILIGKSITLKPPKTCLVRDVAKIDVSVDIVFGFLTLVGGFVILDLKWRYYLNLCTSNSGMLCVHTFMYSKDSPLAI